MTSAVASVWRVYYLDGDLADTIALDRP